ncbi:MAG: hypothetical protein VKO65_09900 [Cyanobacteriota bacterium]|nr:hypothetical protein [Cyanobacteriota bacterium]
MSLLPRSSRRRGPRPAAPGRGWPGFRSLALAVGGLGLLAACPAMVRAQDLVGCRLVEATLQCLPGLDATPQQQIRILQGQISDDLAQEAMVQQDIDGLRQVLLEGSAVEGDLLRARMLVDPGVDLTGLGANAAVYHWYRRAPGRDHWELIPAAQGDTYSVSRNDIAYELMVVVVVPGADGARRSSSAPVGPVRVRNPLATP